MHEVDTCIARLHSSAELYPVACSRGRIGCGEVGGGGQNHREVRDRAKGQARGGRDAEGQDCGSRSTWES